MASKKLHTEQSGDSTIDAQHDALIVRSRRLLAATDQTMLTLCAMDLYQHIREHFADEERLMRKLKYPGLKAHVDQHQGLILKLNAMVKNLSIEPNKNVAWSSFISDLTRNHIDTYDELLSAFLKQRKAVITQDPPKSLIAQ
jgi:hemerythrin-like metal-binding protein